MVVPEAKVSGSAVTTLPVPLANVFQPAKAYPSRAGIAAGKV